MDASRVPRKRTRDVPVCPVIDYAARLDSSMGSTSRRQNRQRRSTLALLSDTSAAGVSLSVSCLGESSHTSLADSYPYLDIGDAVHICQACGARFWLSEQVGFASANRLPRYNQCCKSGRVNICLPSSPPVFVQDLYARVDFLDNIRAYNSMFSMTSFGARIDDMINYARGPYVFRVEGQICHWIGSLCPLPDENPRFLQMYIYDSHNEVSNRLHHFNVGAHTSLQPTIVELLISVLNELNALVKLFRIARDICRKPDVPNFYIRLYYSANQRSYDHPTLDTIGAIVFENSPEATDFDIIICCKDDVPQRINKVHPLYMALQYPLLFLHGEPGWSPDLRLTSDDSNDDRKLTMNMYYSYLIHDRIGSYSLLLRGGRLFQQFLVDAYVCIEQYRLDYIRMNQNRFRTEFFQGVHDAVERGDVEGRAIGKRIFLPSSFTGGPRYMYKHYQDALAICRVHGNPQYFITFTCNVNWPEVSRFMRSCQPLKAHDRPDIISRIFRMKVKALFDFLRTEEPFGKVAADLYTIEFQKRGLPHCHLLLWVTQPFRIHNPADVDRYISAEIPDRIAEPRLYKIVTDSMLHGPCGLARPSSVCMVGGRCSKRFPKSYESSTRFDSNGYVHYRRRTDGEVATKNGIQLDNSYVVPYNKALCLRFEAHINVEYCGWNMVIKYLFKYISKGADRIRFSIGSLPVDRADNSNGVKAKQDEIKNYVDGRFICPHEACWRILDFPIHHRNPPVQVLAVHLENMQNITFRDSQQLQRIVEEPSYKKTILTEWLNTNAYDVSGRHLRYVDFLSEYRWDKTKKQWFRRARQGTPVVGRLIYIHPTCGEPFYLRMLLLHQTGCKNFNDIKTVSGFLCNTYREACEKLGLLGDDNEWCVAFDEASAWATASELRSLFTHMLMFYEISNPINLWVSKWRSMSDDMPRLLGLFQKSNETHIDDDDLQQYVLYEIELLLNSSASPSTLSDFGLPVPRHDLLEKLKNRLLMEERNYDKQLLAQQHETQKRKLNCKQHTVYESVVSSVEARKQIMMFVYGHGGTGKTLLWTTIINALCSRGKIVLAVAASGIASLLLPSGRTAHSRFKIPLDLTEDTICHVKKNTQLGQLLVETSLILWDEAPMNDRKCFEALDRTLKDLHENNHQPFGGKSILLGGDFRQTLPIKRKASKSQIIASALPKSLLWRQFSVVKLTENMRLQRARQNTIDMFEISQFSSWLLQVGDGSIGTPDKDSPDDTRLIEIPEK